MAKPDRSLTNSTDLGDIPEVIRDQSPLPANRQGTSSGGLMIGGGILGVLLLIGGVGIWLSQPKSPLSTEAPTVDEPTLEASPVPTPTPIENVLGHLPYDEAPVTDLEAITPDGRLKLRTAAAIQFKKMQADARQQGISLVAISAFRTVAQQNQLFFDIKQKRNQEARQRAEVSAPPGYSEHHTGYAVDIGDGSVQSTHLSEQFANTAAFQWLEQNAAKYSFELSFPPDNPQGVTYEPWHWRFVGDRPSLELFYKARNLPQPELTPSPTPD